MTSKGYKYSSYKRTVASTEYALGSHEQRSTYRRETGTEYSSAKGATSSKTKEVVSGSDTRTLPVYIATRDYKPEANDKDGLALEEGQIVEVLDNKNPASWLVRTKARPPQTGWAPGSLFESPAEYYRQKRKTREIANGDVYLTKGEEALAKRDTVFHELMRTEEEYVSQLHHLINSYVKVFDDTTTPAPVRQMRDQLTMNLRELYNFHANVLLKGLQYYSDDPGKVGQTFVRLERDFDHHVRYFRDLPDAEKLLDDPKIKEFLDQIRNNIEKDRSLLEYLRSPQVRLQQYQQYLKELIKYTTRAELSTSSLQRALELMLSIPRRATDLNYIKNIQDFPGDTGKLGRLLRHEQFRVWEGDKSGEGSLRYVFLFKSKLVFTERQDPEDPEDLPEFKHVATIRLDKYNVEEDGDLITFTPTEPSSTTYYVLPMDKSQAEFAKQAWVKEVCEAKEGLGPEEGGPPRKKPRSPPAISPSGSTQSVASSSEGMTTTGTLEMQGARVTRTQYGFRTLHESSAKMCLKVSGYPLPIITWFKDGVQLNEDERHKFYSDEEGFFAMTIDPVLVEDTGRYTCVATNEYGQATTSAFFRVVKVEKAPTPPQFITKLQDVEIAEGGSATFECEVEGWPEPEITFFVDGQVIHPSHDFQVEYDGQKATLKIRDVQPEDAGVYAIRLVNEMGVKESQAKLMVREDPDKRKVAPEFQQVIEDKTVDEGDTVKFKALCTGDPEPTVTWQVNGHLLTPGENVNIIAEDGVYILTIKDVSTHFDGEITCRAVNRLGDIACSAHLTVRSKGYEPSFEQELVDKTVRQGGSVKFEVAIAAEPEPAVSWRINGRELKPSQSVKISGRPATGVYTLEILKVTADHIGEIECHAENENGSATSSAKLTLASEPSPETSSESRAPIIKQEFSDITVNVGDTLRLALITEGDAAPPVVRWLLNGKELKPSAEIKMTSKADEGRHELVVDNVTKQLEGSIECVVENDIGSASCKAKVTVTEGERPPTFKAGLPEQLPVETGQSVKIQVDVDSKQPAKVTWLLNGQDVKNMPNHFRVAQDSKDVFNLEILDVTTDLSGEIECVLETVGGKASSKMKLVVSEPEPTMFVEKELPESITITEGEILTLDLKIRSDCGIKKSTWELNGTEIKDSSDVKTTSQFEKGLYSITIKNVTGDFAGNLVCKVENKEGEIAESGTEIKVEPPKKKETKPVIKTEPPKEIKTTVGEPLEIVIITDVQPDAKVSWQLNGEDLKESANIKKTHDPTTGTQVLQVLNVTSDMSGEIICKIENKLGAATATTKVVVEKKAEPPEKKPKLMEEESTTVEEEKLEIKTKRAVAAVEPKITLELQDVLVSPGERLKLELKVSGEPQPSVKWTLNGKEIKETTDIKITMTVDGTHTLEVAKATPDLSGKVVCKAENEAGSSESTCQVAVVRRRAQAKPEFQSKILPISVAEGETLRVRVLVTGDPDPRVKWYINDRIVVETEDTRLLSDNGVYTLEIQGAGTDMAGTLKCVAYNSRGEVSTSAPIRVTQKIPVEFEQYLSDTTCREGDTLKLKAVLLGEPEPQVTWYVNGNKLEESQNVKVYRDKSTYIVVIKDITLDYCGEVLCKAVNEYGEASSSAVLTITPRGTPPDFTEWLSNVTTREGATIKHRVVFTGDPSPKITWYVNNEEVKPTDDDYVVTTENNVCTLVVKKFKPSMVGEIICKAENDAGEVSCTAQMLLKTEDLFSEQSDLEAMISERDEISEGTDVPEEEMTEEHSFRTSTPIMAPRFITKIKDVKVKKGQQAIFECVVPDTKGVVVKWLKDGNEIELIARIRVKNRPGEGNAQLHQLIIESVNTSDSGLYTCVLSNEIGHESSQAVLEVLEEEVPSEMAPEFTKTLESVTVVEGAKAVLECKVAGLPNPVVEWYRDGKRISPNRSIAVESTKDGTHRLVIRETTVRDAGTYEVQISNKVGSAKQQAEVVVKKEEKPDDSKKPTFVSELRSVTVEEKDEIRLECKVTGNPAPEIKWFKNSSEVNKSSAIDIQSKSDGTQLLVIASSTTNDQGEYKCEAVNKVGTSTTTAKVTVNVAPEPMEVEEVKPKDEKPKFTQPMKTQIVTEGETVTLQCTVTGQPMPRLTFFKEEKEVKEDAAHRIVEEADGIRKLIIQKVTASDIGQYKCEAVNAAGTATTEAALKLKEAEKQKTPEAVETAPAFTSALQPCTVKAGETAVFECAVTGTPKPDIKWYKDGQEVKPDATHKIEQLPDGRQKLTIARATEKDIGEYICEASSTAGAVATAADLDVKAAYGRKQSLKEEVAPQFTTGLEACTVPEGETAVLECAVSGKPMPEVKWLKDGEEIQPDAQHKIESLANGQQKLTVVNATEKDVGEYTCEAVNAAGSAASTAQLDVKFAQEISEAGKEETAPEFTKELLTCTVNVGETAQLECAVSGQPLPKVIWMKDGKELKADARHIIESVEATGEHKLTVVESTKLDTGEYSCKAVSSAGAAETVGHLEVKVAEQETLKDEVAPEFSKSLQTCVANEGETVVLECAVTGKPKPEVKWYKNDEEIHADKLHKIESTADGKQQLVIESATTDDIGQYRVEAVSPAGSASTEGNLDVKVIEAKDEKMDVEFAPEFKTPLSACTVAEGETAVFECAVTGTSPIIRWLKDGKELKPSPHVVIESKPDGTQKLVVKDAAAADIGKYEVEASTAGGKAKSDAQLDVKAPKETPVEGLEKSAPEFVGVIHAAQATEGQQAVLECRVVGLPGPTVKWLKGGEEVKPSDKVEIKSKPDGTQQLIFKEAAIGDTGEYRCEATNEAGTAWTEGPLTVKVASSAPVEEPNEIAPDFIEPLKAQRAKEGEEVHMECKVTGVPAPDIRWFKDGEQLKPSTHIEMEAEGDGSLRLIVHQAKMEDLGEYRCEASNVAGIVWSDATLTIHSAPEAAVVEGEEIVLQFSQALHAVHSSEGETATFECRLEKATTNLKPDVHWYKDDAEVKPSDNVKVESLPDGTQRLIVQEATAADVGEYKCEVSKDGQSTETHAPLSVAQQEEMDITEVAPEILKDLKEVKANEGEEAVFECKVSGVPRPEVKWFKDGQEIKPSEHVELKSLPDGTEQLIIQKTEPEDQGNYRISATNPAGSMSSKAPLTVHAADEVEIKPVPTEAPQFIEPLHECKANEGTTAQLECIVTGTPQPKIVWYKDNKPIQASPRHVLESFIDGRQRLTIYQARSEDIGKYHCVALNVAGKAETDADVKVEEKVEEPSFSKGLKNVKVKEGQTVQMACQISMKNQKRLPEIKWYKNGAEIKPDKRVVVHASPDGQCELTIHQTTEEDTGTYICEISNAAGESKTEATVTVEAFRPPEFTGKFEDVTVAEGASCKIETTVSGLPFPEVKWLKDGKELKTKGRIKIHKDEDTGTIGLVIEDAKPEDEGTYRCTLSNEAGSASAKANVTVQGKMEVEEKLEAPKFLRGVENKNAVEGDDVTLSCLISGEPFPEVFWFKGGVPLKQNGHYQIDVGKNGECILKIKNVTPDDTASYTVKIVNSAGQAESVADVYVEGKITLEPPSFIRGLEDRTVTEKSTVVLEVEVNTSEIFVKWLRKGQEVKSVDGVTTVEKVSDKIYRLTIHSISVSVDQGEYTAVATNEAGSATTTGFLTVEKAVELIAPKFRRGLQDQATRPGVQLTMEIEVEGKPKAVKWYKGNNELTTDANIKIEKVDDSIYRLTFTNVKLDDAGDYSVEAINDQGTAMSEAKLTVEALKFPTIVKGLQDVQADEGAKATFEVEVSGKPNTVKWYKNGKEISPSKQIAIHKVDDTRYRLEVESVGPDDEATYRVEAGNEAGTVSSEASLTMKQRAAPTEEEPMEVEQDAEALLTIVRGLEDQQVDEGKDVVLEVELSAAPALLKWYKGGKELKTDAEKRISIDKISDTVYRLTIQSATVDDSGNYKVVASNTAGTVGTEAKVSVEPVTQKPSIVKGLEDTEAPEGGKICLEIEVLGKPKEVKWYRNGKELSADSRIKIDKVDDSHYRLTIADVKQDDQGSYKVEAINDAGVDSSSAALTVKLAEKKQPPKKSPSPVADATLTIVRGLEDTKLDEGDDVTFEIELSDKPASLKWFKGGVELVSNKRIRIDKVNDKIYRLTIGKSQLDDGGTYKFEASNAAGTVTSSAKVSVQPKVEQPKIVKGLKNTEVEEGANVAFEVEVSGKPKTVKWYKNGQELFSDKRIKIDKVDDSHFRLSISDARGDDEATYKVELANDAGTVDSDASLTVRKQIPKEEKSPEPAVEMETEAALTIVKSLEDQLADDGDNVAFDVELSDKPKTVKWYKNGQLLKPDKRYRLEDLGDNKFRLLITGVGKEDEASYRVEASNDSGAASSEAKLAVQGGAPRFRKGLGDKSATVGVKIILEVEVEGKPKTLKWYKNGKELKANKRVLIEKVDDATYRFVVTSVEKDDGGSYKVEASNDYGTAASDGTLTVEEPPKKAKSPEKPSFLKELSDQAIEEGSKASFEVEISGKPKTVKWYKNGREIKADQRVRLEQLDEKSYRMVIGEATKDDEATYKVEAANDAGSVECQAKLTVQPPKPTKEPEEEGVAAKFVFPLRSETVPEGQSVSLTCRVKGTPFPEVAWLKDGMELEASERIQIVIGDDGKCELIIQNAKTDDTGTYTCLAQNIHGGDRTKCTLHVEAKPGAEEMETGEPPEFVKPLRNRTAIEGEDLVLEVKIVGKPMPEVCWFKDDEEIIPSERITGKIDCVSDEVIFRLHIKNARLDDSHTYKCFAQNPYGSASSSGKITVESLKPAEQAPAKFVLPLQETAVVEGKTAIFDVKVRGRPTPELTFYKDRKEITESARVHIEDLGDNRWRLTIENVSSTDAGLYESRCTNSLGSDLCEAHLAVQPPKDRRKVGDDQYPPVFNVPLHDRRIAAGSTMTVECYVDAKPRAQIVWFKGEVQLEEDDRIHVESYPDGKCRLRVLNFTKDDENVYKCVATNELGTAATYANLTVEVIREEERITKKEYAPYFTRDLSDRKVMEGSPFTLECQVDGAPMPDIRWFKDGIPIVPSARVQIEYLDDGTCRLSVPAANSSDMGAYRCVATNKHGASNSVGLIAVEGPKVEKKKEGEAPQFLKGLSDLWIEKGTSFTLRCEIAGTPKPEVKWYKDGTIVRGNERIDIAYSDDGIATLTVQDSSFSDEGFYRCVAENPFGSANSIGTVRVQALREKRQITLDEGEAPKFVVPLENWSCGEGSNVEFDCKVTGKPAPSLKWYKDGAQLMSDHRISFENLTEGRYRLTIQGAKASDEGTYRCVATNEAGAATSKAQLTLEGLAVGLPAGKANGPSFAVPLRDVRAVEGNPLVLECKLNGDPLPDVKWYKDGELLLPSDRIKIETYPDGTARLYIDKCHPSDEGIYRVVAENPSGTANMKANVSVKKAFVPTEAGVLEDDLAKERAPKVIQPLESESSKEGFSVTLACRITGLPTPTIQWFKDGERLYPFGRHQMEHKPDGTIRLTIDQLTTDDAGTYRCVAENYLGTARTTCQLTVEGKVKKTPSKLADELVKGKAPGFLTPLTVKRVQEGSTVVFECLPYGNPFPVIKWLKDGMELSPDDKVSVESLDDGTQRLTIREALVSDEGYYRCVASNEFGTSSTKAELIVEADLAKRSEAKKQKYAAAADEGPPQEQRPRFRRGLRNVTVNQGSPAEFEVAVAGVPQPSIAWYKNGEEIKPNDKTLFWQDDWGFHRLVVLNAQAEDEAEYSCEISNKLGNAKSECSLHVLKDRFVPMLAGEEALPVVADEGRGPHGESRLCPPGFLRQIKNKHVFTGFPAIFDCIVTGNPDVTWYHNGKPIQPNGRIKMQKCGGNSYALVILRTVPEDEGEYICRASNSVGTASSSAVLEVTVPLLDKMQFDGHYDLSQWLGQEFDFHRIPYAGVPSPPDRGPFIAEVTGHYLTLSWIPTRRPPPRYPQISYIVEMRELPDKEWVVVDYNIAQPCCKVRNMELGKSYQFRVRAENIYGISEPSPPSPPSQLMAPPKPVLDKWKRPIPLLDPYAQEALSKAYGDQYACAPWFAPRATDKTACAEQQALEVTFFVYGFPDPEVKWYFRGWEIDSKSPGSRFETKCYGGTECVLKIKDFRPEDAGQYQCIAKNVHGEAHQHIFVELASLPIFLQPLENKIIASDRVLRLDCRVDGNPYPEVKWFKDWHPVVQSSRIKLIHEPPYLHSLLIQEPILRDTGIYTCTASNEAGRVSSTATVTIQAEPSGYEHVELPPRKRPVLLKPRKVREFYEVEEEEIQKDPRFVVHRVTEKATGRKFLAKFMPGKARRAAQNEIDLWNRLHYHPNLPYLWDAFDDGKECCIVYENVTGGGLLDRLVENERVPEAKIALFMRQLLQALEHMHNKNIVHMDLKPENIMLSETGSDQIKLTDFGLSRRLRRDKPTYGVLGAPEFVAPEVVAQKPVSLATDMWSVGVLAYVMLSGKSPFLGDNDNETLLNVLKGSWNFDPKLFEPVSSEAKEFISKLLVLDPRKRLDIHDALAHPWLQLGDAKGEGELLTTQFLKEFKYRHQWVERRIFVQYGTEDEEPYRILQDGFDGVEPTYFPISGAERSRAEATLPLPLAKFSQRLQPPVQQGTEGQLPDPRQQYPLEKGRSDAKRGKDDQKRRPGEDDAPDVAVYVARGEHRPIEDELASRILSDISEEGSVCSEEVASKASSRPFSMDSLVEDRLGELDGVTGGERESTPTQDDYPTTTVIKVAPGIGARMTVQVDDEPVVEKPAQKSPVCISPTREELMEVIVASKAKESQKGPLSKAAAIEPKSLLPLQRSAKLADHEFELLMANAERTKEQYRQRLQDSKSVLRDANGRDHDRRPARPLTDFEVPYPAYELDDYDWDSQYQMGPETFLLQLRDAKMAARVRDYRRHLYGDSAAYVQSGWLGDINNDVTLRERRRYTDLIKNNKDLKEAARDAERSTEAARIGAIKRSRGLQMTFVPAPMPSPVDGTHPPIFQTRLKDAMFSEDGQVTFQCTVLANPAAEIVWFHNDAPILVESGKARYVTTFENKKPTLVIKSASSMDAGTYKCLAKNSLGESFSEAKLRMGDVPDRTSRPDVELASDTEVFITWEAPTPRSGSDILGYKLEFRRAEEWSCPWFVVSDNLDEEAVVIRKLEPLGIYQFKVTPKNTLSWGEPSLASRIIQTHARGAPKLNIDLLRRDYHFNIVNLPHGGALGEIPEEGGSLEGSPSPSERREQALKTSLELNTKEDPKTRFQLESEIFRGRFCLVRNAVDKQSESAAHCVAKVLMANPDMRRQAMQEYETLREIQHDHVVALLSAYLREDFLILFLEKLSDNLVERFTYHDYYTEEQVVRVMSQLLSALQWIHFKGICHLDLQPDNIMFVTKRSWNVKLLDTGTAVRLSRENEETKVERLGSPEFSAPEVLHSGRVTPAADIWGLGLLSYLLLSGMHPFMVDDSSSLEEVVRNIVREKLDLNFIYTNTSQEALRFMTWALKKQPGNRMNTEEGLQHRWLSFHETMIRRRENIKFSANRLRMFARGYYHARRMAATNNNQLLSVYGNKGPVGRGLKHSPSM